MLFLYAPKYSDTYGIQRCMVLYTLARILPQDQRTTTKKRWLCTTDSTAAITIASDAAAAAVIE